MSEAPGPGFAAPAKAALRAGLARRFSGVGAWFYRQGALFLQCCARTVARLGRELRKNGPAQLLIGLLALVIVNLWAPFGMEEVARQQASRIMQRVLSPFHGRWGRTTAGQDAITVVTLDDAFFGKLPPVAGQGSMIAPQRVVWPMPINTLEKLIDHLASAAPKAIFLDLAFPIAPREIMPRKIMPDQADSRDAALTALAGYLDSYAAKHPGIPLLIGEVLDPSPEQQDENCGEPAYIFEDQLDSVRITAPVLQHIADLKPPPPNVYFVNLAARSAGPDTYRLASARLGQRHNCQQQRAGNFVASPALALFSLVTRPCVARAATPDSCADDPVGALAARIALNKKPGELLRYDVVGEGADSAKLSGAQSLQWGVTLSPAMRRKLWGASNADFCINQIQPGLSAPLSSYWANLIGNAEAELNRQRCVYIDNISAANAGQGIILQADTDHQLDVDPTLLKDRILLVGADVTQARDFYTSPVNGQLPGVYQHAVALENLLTDGKDYHWQRAEAQWLPQLIALALAVVLRAFLSVLLEAQRRAVAVTPGALAKTARILVYLPGAGLLFMALLLPAAALLNRTDLSASDMVFPLLLFHLTFIEKVFEVLEDAVKHALAPLLGAKRQRADAGTAA